jgi:hypothetical protein
MNERDEKMPAATRAVVGRTHPSVQERGVSANIAAKLRDVDPAARLPLGPLLDRKRRGHDGHARPSSPSVKV